MFSKRTTTALLDGLHDPGNSQAWEELDARCRPIMRAVARRMGLSDAEADDAVQAAMLQFLQAYRAGGYDRSRGRLGSFLVTILRSRAIDAQRREGRRRDAAQIQSDTPMSVADTERIWMDERHNQLLRHAMQELRDAGADERMIAAFELFGLRGVSIADVTASLSMTREEVYNAKYRIAKRLQPIIARLDQLYEDL